jgi:hypothetical protein
LKALANHVAVNTDESLNDTTARVVILLKSGSTVSDLYDLSAPIADEVLERGLRAKAKGLLGGETAERVWFAVSKIENISAQDIGRLLAP